MKYFEAIKDKIFKGNERTITIKKNILYSFVIKGVSILTSLLLVPITLGYVSSEIYGVWLTLSSVLHWLTYMDVGFTLGLKNRLAEALAKKNYEKGRELVSTTYIMMSVVFIPVAIIAWIVSPFINWCAILNISDINHDVVLKTVQILFAFVSLQMIVNVFVSVVAAYQKTALSSLFQVIGQVCSLIIISTMTLFVAPSLTNLAFAYSLMPIIIVLIASFVFFKTSMKEVAPSLRYFNKKLVKEIWGLGIKFFIISVQMIVLYQSTNLLISHIAGPESVTQYNIAYKLLNVVVMFYGIILTPLWPAFTNAYTQKDFHWMNNVYKKMKKVYFVFLCLILIFVICSPLIFKLWIGDKVVIPVMLTSSIALYTLIHCWDTLQVALINGVGAINLQTYVTIVGIVLHIPLSLLLGKYIGIYGVIVSMIFINLIYATFFTIQINKILKQKASGIWAK